MGKLMSGAGASDNIALKWKNMFNIFISEKLSEESAMATILHEIGHVDEVMRMSKLAEADIDKIYNREFYAEAYAYDRLCEVFGPEKGSTIFSKYLDENGIAKGSFESN
jgi:hypothetical protein